MDRLFPKKREKQIVNGARNYIDELYQFVIKNDFDNKYSEDLKKIIDNLDKESKIVVIGEVNSGKSSFINALVKEDICNVDSSPCTDCIYEISYGKEKSERINKDNIKNICIKNDMVKNFTIVDTPGVNSPIKKHSQITYEYILNADLIFVVFSAKNPFGQAVWQLLSQVKGDLSKNIVFVMQQIDLVKSEDLKDNIEYIKNFAIKKEFTSPVIFPVSAKYEAEGKEEAGFNELREYINKSLVKENQIEDKIYGRMSIVDDITDDIKDLIYNKKNNDDKLMDKKRIRDQEIKDLIKRNKETSGVILSRYSSYYINVLDEVDSNIVEITHIKSIYKSLKNKISLLNLFEGIFQKHKKRKNKLIKEFNNEIIGDMNRLKEDIKRKLSESDSEKLNLSQKELYKLIDQKYDLVVDYVEARITDEKRDSLLLKDTMNKYDKELQKSVASSNMIVVITCIIIMVIIPAGIAIGIVNFVRNIFAETSLSEAVDLTENIKQVYDFIPEGVKNSAFKAASASQMPGVASILMNFLWLIPIAIIIDVLTYIMVRFISNKWLMKKLKAISLKTYDHYKSKEKDLVSEFNQDLMAELDEIESLLLKQFGEVFNHSQDERSTEKDLSIVVKEFEYLNEMRKEIDDRLTC